MNEKPSGRLLYAYNTIKRLEEKAQSVRDVIIFSERPCIQRNDAEGYVLMPIETYEKLIEEMNK